MGGKHGGFCGRFFGGMAAAPRSCLQENRLGFPLGRVTWKCINIRMATNESEFILGKACWIH
jgi:hypothetical protein